MRPALCALIPLTLIASCAQPGASSSGEPRGWRQETAFDSGKKLGGCALGDLDPSSEGQEIAVVGGSGEVWVIRAEADGWRSEAVRRLPGEMIQCAVGDLLPDRPGDELVTIGATTGGEDDGGPGAAWVFWRDGDGWAGEQVFEDTALLHAVCIPGPGELIVAGYSRKVSRLRRGDDGWERVGSADLAGPAKGAAWSAAGLVVCDEGGQLNAFGPDLQPLGSVPPFPDPQARIARDGTRILVCDNGGKLRLLDSPSASPVLVHEEEDRLRGAVLDDLLPERAGLECATAGYSGRITVLHATEDGGWEAEVAGTDSDRFHHLCSGELPGRGRCLVGCGYSGRVTVLSRE